MLSQQILTAEYKTELSEARWETPQEASTITSRCDAMFLCLDRSRIVRASLISSGRQRPSWRRRSWRGWTTTWLASSSAPSSARSTRSTSTAPRRSASGRTSRSPTARRRRRWSTFLRRRSAGDLRSTCADRLAAIQAALSALAAYESDKVDVTNINVKSLKALGHKIVTAEYKTDISQARWETPQEIKVSSLCSSAVPNDS